MLPEDIETHQMDSVIRMRDVTAKYRERELPRFKGNHGMHARCRIVLALRDSMFGDVDVDVHQFGPLQLESLRDHLIAKRNYRRYINDQIHDVIRLFTLGVRRELVKPERITALESLPALSRGQAADRPRRKGADLRDVAVIVRDAPSDVAAPTCHRMPTKRVVQSHARSD